MHRKANISADKRTSIGTIKVASVLQEGFFVIRKGTAKTNKKHIKFIVL